MLPTMGCDTAGCFRAQNDWDIVTSHCIVIKSPSWDVSRAAKSCVTSASVTGWFPPSKAFLQVSLFQPLSVAVSSVFR